MAKIKVIENASDRFRISLGSQQQIISNGITSRLDFANTDLFNVEVSGKPMLLDPDGVLPTEITNLIIRPTSRSSNNFAEMVNNYIQQGVMLSDHFCSINLPVHSSEVESINVSRTANTYDILTKFNYSSGELEAIQGSISETNLPTLFSKVTETEFNSSDLPIDFDSSQRAGRGTQIYFPQDNSATTTPLEEFPVYNSIRVSNRTDNSFSNFLKEKIKSEQGFLSSYLSTQNDFIRFNVKVGSDSPIQMDIPVFNVNKWAQSNMDEEAQEIFKPSDEVAPPIAQMIINYRKMLFTGFVNKLSRKFRRYSEILNKQTCTTEDYLFSVDKFVGPIIGLKEQTFYAPAANDSTFIHDTQVFEGQTYGYSCSGHYLIVGNKYYYRNLQVRPFQNYATVEVVNRPSVVIVPLELFKESIVAVQPPPLPPQVKFSTKLNSSNLIKMHLSPTKGMLYDQFTTLVASDENQLSSMDLNKRRNQTDYRFQTGDDSANFEIFRLNDPPKDLSDFAIGRRKEVKQSTFATDAVFKDKLKPNEKYYYIFRNVNGRGFVSNPTSIYEVELLIDADDSKIVVNNYEPPKLETHRLRHEFQSLFQIKPNINHTSFNDEQPAILESNSLSGKIDDLHLGVASKSLWDRKMKFRIRSTTSGKIIDYNVTFKLTKNKTEEDF